MKQFKEYLSESSLSRIYQHFNSEREIGTMSAFRGEYSYEENVRRNKQLARQVRSAGFGFIYVDGAWVENEGTDDEQEVSEVSLFIIGDENSTKLKDYLVKWAKEFDQDGVVYKPSDQTGAAQILDKNGNVEMKFNNTHYDRVAEIYTKLRHGSHAGKSFYFESVRLQDNFYTKLLHSANKDKGE